MPNTVQLNSVVDFLYSLLSFFQLTRLGELRLFYSPCWGPRPQGKNVASTVVDCDLVEICKPRSSRVQQVHGDRVITAETQGAQNICLFGRLSVMRSLAGERGTEHGDAHVSSNESGVQNQLCQKPADSISGDRVSGLMNRLCGIPHWKGG